MVTHLQHIRMPIEVFTPMIQHVIFGRHFHIAGEEEFSIPELHHQHDGSVVGFGVGLYRAKHGYGSAAKGEPVAGSGDGDLQTLLIGVINEIIKTVGTVGLGRRVNGFGFKHGQYAGQTTHMIFVGMGSDDGFQLCNALLFQIADYKRTVGHIAAIYEYVLPATLQKGTIRLAYVDKVNS